MLTLYHFWSSVCSQKVRIVLAEKQLGWNSVHIDLQTFGHCQPGYMAMNHNAVVPTLVYDGKPIIESNTICEFLEDAYPDRELRPNDPYLAASMRNWMILSEEGLHKNMGTVSYNSRNRVRQAARYTEDQLFATVEPLRGADYARMVVNRMKNGIPEADEAAAWIKIKRALDIMEAGLESGPWLLGETYSLADIAFMPYINRLDVLNQPGSIEAEVRPGIAEWWSRVQALDSFKEMAAYKNPDEADPVAR